ncbi:MAG: hypothetical protein WDN76_07280 [Alphaproteobacteria bacterium]
MMNYLFTFRTARSGGVGTISAAFDDDDDALSHAHGLLAQYAIVDVARGATRLAHFTAPTEFGRKRRFAAGATPPRKGLAGFFKR